MVSAQSWESIDAYIYIIVIKHPYSKNSNDVLFFMDNLQTYDSGLAVFAEGGKNRR